jgi:hypothetical protein
MMREVMVVVLKEEEVEVVAPQPLIVGLASAEAIRKHYDIVAL